MQTNTCKTCGGTLVREGNYYVCQCCLNKWIIDVADDVHAVQRANAWEALRQNDFEKAIELFENIILKDKKNHEAYWGRALASNGIVYVNDYSENKKVPTCNNITEQSFLENSDVKQAINLAPKDIAETYRKIAEYIEKVRVEWLQKASKEPPYDIFICFKDSDREHGLNRTQDSVDVQDLYTALVDKGYKVFFSRVTLRDKVAEQYEPYIYGALKTAKVMIVFGEKAEYFNAVWVKNEWTRYKARLEKGEKHKNSLIAVYKNMDVYDIPMALTGGRQAIDYGIPSNFEVLIKHIERVIAESKNKLKIDKIEVTGGQIAKKSSQIQQESLKTREIGRGAAITTSIDESQKLSLVTTYLNNAQWKDASNLLDDILFNNPNCANAIWFTLYAEYQCKDDVSLLKKLPSFTTADYGTMERMLNCAEKDKAYAILNKLFDAANSCDETTCHKILSFALPYNYPDREKRISECFNYVIEKAYFTPFELLLTTLNKNDVDSYIAYNLSFAQKSSSIEHRRYCLNNILNVDEGNLAALEICLCDYLKANKSPNEVIALFEKYLKYSQNVAAGVSKFLKLIAQEFNINHCEIAKRALKYYPNDLSNIKQDIIDIAYRMIYHGFFKDAEYFLSLVISVDANNASAYWGICLAKLNVKSEKDIVNANQSLKDIPEYTKYLTLVDEARRNDCISLVNFCETEKKRKAHHRKSITLNIIVIIVSIVVVVGVDVFFCIYCCSRIGANVGGNISYCVAMCVVCCVFIVIGPTAIIVGPIISVVAKEQIKIYDENYKKKHIVIRDNVSERQFENHFELRGVVIQETVSVIDSHAFCGCYGLEEVKINSKRLFIGNGAFDRCFNLKRIYLEHYCSMHNASNDDLTNVIYYRSDSKPSCEGNYWHYGGAHGIEIVEWPQKKEK